MSASDRQALNRVRARGCHRARETNRAHILVALADRIPDAQIGAVLGVSRKVIWRTRSACEEHGLAYALHGVSRPGPPRKYRADHAQAVVAAVACSPPPAGAKRWTLKLLVEVVGQRTGLEGINRETVRQCLKRTA